MLNCKNITENASDYIDKELPLHKRLQMKLHLTMCVHCRHYIQQIHTTIGIVKHSPIIISDNQAKEIIKKIFKQKK